MRKFVLSNLAMAACMLLVVATPGRAQGDYPTRPIRLLVGSEPGGTTDLVARVISKQLGQLLGQSVVVENRPGANQTIAAELVSKAAPDGYVLLMVPAGFGINPALYKKLPYDSLKDFTPVSEVALAPNVLVVNPSVPARSIKELIALAKAKPGSLSYGSSGVGAPSHLAGALFALLTGIDIVHVPYKGSGPAMTDLLSGNIQLSLPSIPGALPFISSHQLIALGVTTRIRSSSLTTVPTIAEVRGAKLRCGKLVWHFRTGGLARTGRCAAQRRGQSGAQRRRPAAASGARRRRTGRRHARGFHRSHHDRHQKMDPGARGRQD